MTDAQNGSYEVAIGKRAVFVRVHGLGSMNNCLCLRDFVEELLQAGRSFLVIDLTDCTGMDSTFMGLIAGAAAFEQGESTVGVAVVNANDALVGLLKSVGLMELVFVEPEPFEVPALEFQRLEEPASEDERLALVRSAHEHLIKICDENERLFGPLVRTLEKEMRERGLLESA